MTNTQFDSIPPDLRQRAQWVCSLPNKRPVQPNGKAASATDPATWSTFDACRAAALIHSGWGVAFIFTKDDPFAVIDLDHVIKDGIIEPWAQSIIDTLLSYTELSRSKTGVHIIVRGVLPGVGNKAGRFEIYDAVKAMTLTGHVLGNYAIRDYDLADLQARLTTLDPEYHGTTVRHRDSHTDGKSQSESDFSKIGFLIRVLRTKDADLLEAEFRKRFPAEYERKGPRCGKSYIRYSIDRFLGRLA